MNIITHNSYSIRQNICIISTFNQGTSTTSNSWPDWWRYIEFEYRYQKQYLHHFKISSLRIPFSCTALPTSDSLPYSWAVSMCQYPIFEAYLTVRRVISLGGDWYTPSPMRGISIPLFSLARDSRVNSIKWVVIRS